MRKTLILLSAALSFSFAACALDAPDQDAGSDRAKITKEEARLRTGKADGIDWCDWMGWYGDGVCDHWCAKPDPDCDAGTACGETTCYGDTVCCNESCGICTQPGDFCTQQLCDSDPDPEPKNCGGLLGLQCDEGDYCDYDETQTVCGAADGMGTCKPKPEACSYELNEVCGCDSVTYGNSCFANLAGVDVASEGACDQGDDREVATGQCVRSRPDSCETDADCNTGGCGGELCHNPEAGPGVTTCDCFGPGEPVGGCGCVNGTCAWYK